MKENADKYLDDLSRKVMGKSMLETTSIDFTNHVMSKVKATNTSKVTTYEPLLSTRIWMLIALGFASVVGYTIIKSPSHQQSWLTNLNLIEMPTFEFINPLESFDISQTTMYAFLLLALMSWIQIPLLKHFFNKRLQ